ncbi:putative ATPase YjoB [Rubripirellula tenax]|uniref:Putative ATPase YjoB n=1 Tax=Rubripirellula tenax TaxID=2528015 RepID=A0A5C6E982_9BACT|nr:AAA family ATPase [Rubripirellula tenax]TWU44467.1 putative ATPase YjoB [Rubripirellula tenax]
MEWENSCGGDNRDWVIAESIEIAEEFILDVSRKTHAPGNAILVFSGGRWNRSEALYNATQSASFEDLVLADDLKATIRDDFNAFLQSEDRYNRLGISWRRGALLIGPPGNGKTHCVRALVKELSVSSLYVQSLSHQYYTPEQMWHQVFDRARGLRPCRHHATNLPVHNSVSADSLFRGIEQTFVTA